MYKRLAVDFPFQNSLEREAHFWNCGLVRPFFKPFGALPLSQQNLGLEFGGLVL